MSILGRKERKAASHAEADALRTLKREIKIGAFVTVALVILAVFIFIVGDISQLLKRGGYPLFVYFDSVAGLEKGTVVRIAGLKVGYVRDIRLKGSQAEVELSIFPEVKVKQGSRATLAVLGLLGEKYIEILPGKEEGFNQPGETIEGLPPVSFDQLGNMLLAVGEEVKKIGDSVRDILGEEETKTSFRDTLQNLADFTADLKDFLGNSSQGFSQNMERAAEVMEKIEIRTETLSQNLDELILLVKDTVGENRINLKENLENIRDLIARIQESLRILNDSLEKINRGQGTIGKLIHQPDLYDRAEEAVGGIEKVIRPLSSLRLRLDLRTDYYGSSALVKNYLSLGLWSGARHFLLGQVIHDPWQDRFTYSAQGGIRWGSISPRAGIMESRFGAGADYYVLQDRLRFSLEAYDFNRNPRPRLRFWTQFNASKYLAFLAGVEDFSLAANREFFFGLSLGL